MINPVYAYTDSYATMKHRFKNNYPALIVERRRLAIEIDSLRMKNGQPLRFLMTPDMLTVLSSIEESLRITKVDTRAKTGIYEGFYSSVIEGAQSTLPETIKMIESGRPPENKSERMIANNVKVINDYLSRDFPFTEEAVLSAWSHMVGGVCDNESVRGNKYRDGRVIIGDGMGVVYEPPPAEEVQSYMNMLYFFFQSPPDLSPILQAILIHYYFVYVHPFCDGNGRMSRFLLYQWLIQHSETYKFKFISLSDAVNLDRRAYYRVLANSENMLNDITYFVDYYLRVMEFQLSRSIDFFGVDKPLNKRQIAIKERITAGGISRAKYAKAYGISVATAKVDLDALVDAGYFKAVRNKSGVYVYYKALP